LSYRSKQPFLYALLVFAPFSSKIPYQYTPLLTLRPWLAALYYAANPIISDCIFNLCFFFIYAQFFFEHSQAVKARAWCSLTDKIAK